MASINPRLPRPTEIPSSDGIVSSSPAFGTPLHPILPSQRTKPVPAPALIKPTILPILLPPATLRPLAFRTFTKKHNLTLQSSALATLATFIGRHCGSEWREEGLAEKVLEEVAKSWKKQGGTVIVDGEGDMLKGILKFLEGSMSGGRIMAGKTASLGKQGSFKFGADVRESQDGEPHRPALESQSSFGISSLEVEDHEEEDEKAKDPREWVKVINAFEQPRLVYNIGKKTFERSSTKASLFPSPARMTDLFRQRYNLIHQRVLRNDAFQAPSFSANSRKALNRSGSISSNDTHRITPIANLLGRSGTTHLLLGLLTVTPTGALALSDLTGSILLDLSHARPIPDDGGSWFTPGMIVLVDGSYEEDYNNLTAGSSSSLGNTGGIGGMIGGKFVSFSVGHPPCERRSATLGIADSQARSSGETISGPAFGWTDFLGLGSERATGARMRRLQTRLLPTRPVYVPDDLRSSPPPGQNSQRSSTVVVASNLTFSNPATLSALRILLSTYASLPVSSYPLAFVLIGSFASHPALSGATGADSISYKESFDAAASVFAEFPALIARTTLVFVPGDNDGWPSAFSAGASTPLPRKPVPDMFTSRLRRVVADANREVHGAQGPRSGRAGEVVWASNPTRLTWFGCVGEMVILRDDVLGRLRRTAVRFRKPEADDEEGAPHETGQDGERTPRMQSQAPFLEMSGAIPSSPPLGPVDEPENMDVDAAQAQRQGEDGQEVDSTVATARALTLTLLSQSYLSPFPLSTRPVLWDYGAALSLYPLPSALVVADSEAPSFVQAYMGCCVVNPGKITEEGKTRGRGGEAVAWAEYDITTGKGSLRRV